MPDLPSPYDPSQADATSAMLAISRQLHECIEALSRGAPEATQVKLEYIEANIALLTTQLTELRRTLEALTLRVERVSTWPETSLSVLKLLLPLLPWIISAMGAAYWLGSQGPQVPKK